MYFRPTAKSVKYILTEVMYIDYYKFGIPKHDIERIVNFVYENEDLSVLLYKIHITINEIFKLHI